MLNSVGALFMAMSFRLFENGTYYILYNPANLGSIGSCGIISHGLINLTMPSRASFVRGRIGALPSITQGGSPVRESRSPGSVRGVFSNGHSYRDSGCGEVMCMGAERPKFIWIEGRRCVPVVIAG